MDRSKVLILLTALVFMIAGYLLMIGGGATDPNVYPEKELYGPQRTIIAPILVLIGLALMVVAIMKKNKYLQAGPNEK